MSEEFLKTFYKMCGGEYKILERYKVGKEVDIPNSQTDEIVEYLDNMRLVKTLEKPRYFLTFEGKQEVERS